MSIHWRYGGCLMKLKIFFVKISAWQRIFPFLPPHAKVYHPAELPAPNAHITRKKEFLSKGSFIQKCLLTIYGPLNGFRHSCDCKLWMRFPLSCRTMPVRMQSQRRVSFYAFLKCGTSSPYGTQRSLMEIEKTCTKRVRSKRRKREHVKVAQVCNCLRSLDICTLQKQLRSWRSKISPYFLEFHCKSLLCSEIKRSF